MQQKRKIKGNICEQPNSTIFALLHVFQLYNHFTMIGGTSIIYWTQYACQVWPKVQGKIDGHLALVWTLHLL